MNSNTTNRRKLVVLVCLCIVVVFAVAVLSFILTQKKERIVGMHIPAEDVTEFYYTLATSTNPPDYQRYHFHVKGDAFLLYHETREGNHWPLTEEDITLSGTIALQNEQWAQLMQLLNDGKVVRRSDSAEAGGSGLCLYLYWTGDKGEYQVFSFASYDKLAAFEALCTELVGADAN